MKNEANSNAGRHGARTAEGWLPVKTRDARKPEVGTEDATLHCGEDWSVDAFAHKPNKYCTYNLAPKRGPYSLAPRLSPVADPEAPIMPLVTCPVFTERVYDYWGLSGECHKQLSKEICFAAYGNLFRHLQIYKTLILTDHITSEPYTVQTSQMYSTWRWVQAAATSIQPHNFFFFSTKHVH